MIVVVALTWKRRHFGPGATAYDGARIFGEVARYDETDRPGSVRIIGHFYIGYVRGDPVSGRCATFDEAQHAVERLAAASVTP